MLFREHRGSLAESTETMITVNDVTEMKQHISKLFGVSVEAISFDDKVVFDERINWHTQYVIIDKSWVCGMADLKHTKANK